MPTYQYACTSCGEELEVVQSFTSDPLTECPACGGRLRKVFHPVGVVFKGSGFYRTDSRKAGSGTTGGGGTSSTSSPSSSSTSSSSTSSSSSTASSSGPSTGGSSGGSSGGGSGSGSS